MPTPDELVAAATTYFFTTALPQATGRSYADLPAPSTHLGAYVRSDGQPVATTAGTTITPEFGLRVSPALPVVGGRPDPSGASAPSAGPLRSLVWLRTAADPVVDDAAEIQRVMADLDSFVAVFSTPAGEGAPATATQEAGARAAEWAAAVVAARAALPADLASLTAVPAALQAVAPDVESLKEVLQHFFTYGEDGRRYARWSGAGRDGSNPAHLTAEYKQANVLERRLEREQVYVFAVLPESVLTGTGDLGAPVFREVVLRLLPTGLADRPFSLATLHTVRSSLVAAPHCDFVFFYARDGLGIPVPAADRTKLTGRLLNLIGRLDASSDPATAAQVLDAAEVASPDAAGTGRLVHLIATLEGEPALPAGVVAETEGPVRILQVPPAQLAAVAALPQVKHLGLLTPCSLDNDQAQAMVNLPGLLAKLTPAQQGGQGVLVGIIDSGIDASHPAFAGRIHAVWDQGNPSASGPGNSPLANHPGNAAYAQMNFGVELSGAAVAASGDPNGPRPANGHGTHVSGTAAGAQVVDGGVVTMAAGGAPQARIAVVRAIQAGRGDPVLAVKWIFQKATELGVPCVINMSFGHTDSAHDGSDAMARRMFALCRDAAGNYLPGRVLVAAAGNDRSKNAHVSRTLAAGSTRQTLATLQLAGGPEATVTIWVKDPTGTKPAAFPLSAWVYRRSQRRNTFKDFTRVVNLGQQASPSTHSGTTVAGRFVHHRTDVEITTVVSHPVNGDHNFHVRFASTVAGQPMVQNQWGIVVDNPSPHPLEVHVWVTGGAAILMGATADDDTSFLVGTPADSAATISVASCNSRLSWNDNRTPSQGHAMPNETRLKEISSFSSPGPLRTGSVPPSAFYGVPHALNGVDVTAPGAQVASALSSQVATPAWLAVPANQDFVVNNRTRIMQGTSMATPTVTGIVANLLARRPTLTMPAVLALLRDASAIPADSDYQASAGAPAPKLSVDWGYGLIDASKIAV